jgi:hypothetical protein
MKTQFAVGRCKKCIETTESCPAIPRFSSLTELQSLSVRMLFWLPYIEIESNYPSFPNVKFTFDIVIISWNCWSNPGILVQFLNFKSANLDFHHRHYDWWLKFSHLFIYYLFFQFKWKWCACKITHAPIIIYNRINLIIVKPKTLCIVDSCLSAHYFMRTTKNISKCVAVWIVTVLGSWNDKKAVGKYLTFVKKMFL